MHGIAGRMLLSQILAISTYGCGLLRDLHPGNAMPAHSCFQRVLNNCLTDFLHFQANLRRITLMRLVITSGRYRPAFYSMRFALNA